MESTNKKILKDLSIEQHPAWCGELSVAEITLLLANQKPFTYLITKCPDETFLLSYMKNHDQGIKHISFKKVAIMLGNKCVKKGYQNGSNIIFSTVESLIRYKLKGKGTLPEQFTVRLIA